MTISELKLPFHAAKMVGINDVRSPGDAETAAMFTFSNIFNNFANQNVLYIFSKQFSQPSDVIFPWHWPISFSNKLEEKKPFFFMSCE